MNSSDKTKPKTLYKYRSLSGIAGQYTFEILSNSKIYFAKPKEFNDPFECQAQIVASDFKERIKGLTEDNVPTFIENVRKDMRESLRVLSLSEINDDICQWTIILTHYRTIKLTHPHTLVYVDFLFQPIAFSTYHKNM